MCKTVDIFNYMIYKYDWYDFTVSRWRSVGNCFGNNCRTFVFLKVLLFFQTVMFSGAVQAFGVGMFVGKGPIIEKTKPHQKKTISLNTTSFHKRADQDRSQHAPKKKHGK